MGEAAERLRRRLLDDSLRTGKPRTDGATIILDVGLGIQAVRDLCEVGGSFCDYAKIAWASALITPNLAEKIAVYREHQIHTLLGGTLFEYALMRNRAEDLLAFVRDTQLHIELSDGCVALPRAEKLRWIERFAAHTSVFSEVGGKTVRHEVDWVATIREDLSAGASHVVIEGREIGPPGEEIRADIVRLLVDSFESHVLFFEALERGQQVWLLRTLGPNVSLGNIRPEALLTLESFRRGLKEHTLWSAVDWGCAEGVDRMSFDHDLRPPQSPPPQGPKNR